jgi:hypothetical protein
MASPVRSTLPSKPAFARLFNRGAVTGERSKLSDRVPGERSVQEKYKGHTIVAETYPIAKGYRWTYQIDGGDIRECRDRPLRNEKVALAEAVGKAKAEIDSQQSGASVT